MQNEFKLQIAKQNFEIQKNKTQLKLQSDQVLKIRKIIIIFKH